MLYIYQILAVILIAISVAAYAGDRRVGVLLFTVISVGCAAFTIATYAWWPLVVGLAAYLLMLALQRDDSSAHAAKAH